MSVLTSETQDAVVEEGVPATELVETEADTDDTRREDTERLLDPREAEDETEGEEAEVDDPAVEVEADDMADRDVVETDDDEKLLLAEELDGRAEDGAVDEEAVTTTPFTLRGIPRSPSPVDRYNATLFH